MTSQYKLSPAQQHDGFTSRDLHQRAADVFGAPSWHATPSATIVVSDDDGSAYVLTHGVPVGLLALNFEHALAFCSAILGATHIDCAP